MNIPEIGFNHKKTANHEIEIIDLAELYQRKNSLVHNPGLPHRVNFHLLIYIEQGEGSHLIDFVNYPYHSGMFITIQRNQVHAFDFSNKPKGQVILFTQAFVDQALANMRVPEFTPTYLKSVYQPVFAPTHQVLESCQNLLAEMTKELKLREPDPLIAMFLFSSLFLKLRRGRQEQCDKQLNQDQHDKFSLFIELVEQQFQQSREATYYAQQLHTTYKTLNHICKLATNQTAKQLIDGYTILEVKRRLVLDQSPIQQLAYDFGFDDASNFVKFFKKHTSLTPARFQKQYTVAKLTPLIK